MKLRRLIRSLFETFYEKSIFCHSMISKKLRYMNYYIWYHFWVMWVSDRVILIKLVKTSKISKNRILQRFVIQISNWFGIRNLVLNLNLNPKSGFQICLESEIWISNLFGIWNLDFKSVWNPKSGFQICLESEICISNQIQK